MKRLLLILSIALLIYATGCGGKAATTAQEPVSATVSTAITPTKPAPIIRADEEVAAQQAMVSGDWLKAFDEYSRLIKQDVKSPVAEYYLYQLLHVADYASGISGTDMAGIINHLAESPDTNDNLRALAVWFQTQALIRKGELDKAKTNIDTLGFVPEYVFIGPFENEEETGFNTEYDVEKELDFDKTYTGKQGQNKWFNVPSAPVWGWVDMSAMFRLNEDVLSYALVFVNSPQEQDALIKFGSDGAAKLWLNDNIIVTSDCYRGLYLDQDTPAVRLSQGWNKILVKVCQKAGPWRFMLRLTSPTGQALAGLNYAAKPDQIKELLSKTPVQPLKSQLQPITATCIFSYFESKLNDNADDAVSMRRLAMLYDVKKALDENDRKDRDLLKRALELDGNDVLTHIAFTHAEPDRNKRLESYNAALKLAADSALVYYEFSRSYTTDPSFFKGLGFDWSDYFEELMANAEEGGDSDSDSGYDSGKSIRRAQKHTLSPKRMPFPLESKEIELLQKALELKPGFHKARIALAKAYQRRSDQIWQKEAESIYSGLLKDMPENMDLQESVFYTKSRLPAERIEFCQSQLKQDFTYNKARYGLIGLYRQIGDYKTALELCFEMLKINPYNYKVYNTTAAIYKSVDDWENATHSLLNALAIAPENTSLLKLLADYYLYQGQTKLAIAELEDALKIKPQLKEVEKHLKYLKSSEKEKDFWDGYEEKIAAYLEKAKSAVQTDEKESARWILYNQIIRVKSNGTSSTFVQQVIKIFDDNGRNDYGYVSAFPRRLEYYPSTKSEVKQAKVYRKQAGSDEYMEIEGQYQENSSYAAFPRLEVGDIITFECQIDEVGEGRYRDYFGLMCSLQNRDEPVETSKLTLISPKNKPVYHEAVRCANAKPEETEKTEQGLIVRTWTENNIPQIKNEPLRPADFEIWPYIHFSTFKTWDEVAEWFWGLAKDQLETSPELKAAVKKAVENLTDDRSKIRAVYQLMVSAIRYEEVSLESHYFKPFKASDTFARKYGDCKDTAILLIAMLKEVGIQADPVLIRATPTEIGVVNTDLPSMKIFNHAIAHLYKEDGSDFFLDGTARYCGAEEMPYMDQGAVAFVVSPTGKSKCLVTKFAPSASNLTQADYTVEIYPNRDASWQEHTVIRGQIAPLYRQGFQDGTKQKLIYEQIYNQVFKGTTISSVEFSDLTDYNQPVEVKASLKISDFARKEEEKMIFRPIPLPTKLYGADLSDITSAETRYYDMIMYFLVADKTSFTYKIPEGYVVGSMPESVSLENDYAKYACTYSKIDDRQLRVEVEFDLKSVRIPKDKYAEFRDFCVKASKSAEHEVVLERK
ncbi:MAG: DUF3857 domain-containing protein [Candidatus Brocadiia bacterium]